MGLEACRDFLKLFAYNCKKPWRHLPDAFGAFGSPYIMSAGVT